MLLIDLSKQSLSLIENNRELLGFPVSTARNGAGEIDGSGCTPRGQHRIRIKIGSQCSENTVFIGRRPSGETYTPELAKKYPERDWVLTRILWLSGMESGVNRGGEVDTLRRFIYIHGCPDTQPMGVPLSHGCIRMRNRDLLELFERVENGTLVEINE